MLGMGEDGHTASLFPNTEALKDATPALVKYSEAPSTTPVVKRMTLSFAALNNAKRAAMLVLGQRKHSLITEVHTLRSLLFTSKTNAQVHIYTCLAIRKPDGKCSKMACDWP